MVHLRDFRLSVFKFLLLSHWSLLVGCCIITKPEKKRWSKYVTINLLCSIRESIYTPFIDKLIFPMDSLNVVECILVLQLYFWIFFHYSLNLILMHECTAYCLYYTTVWNWQALLLHVSTLMYACALIVNKYALNSVCVLCWSTWWCYVLWVAADVSESATLLFINYPDFFFFLVFATLISL